MGNLLVLINGLPGAGKTTLGRALAPVLNARLLSKDAVKEALASCLDNADDIPALGGIAMDTVWALARAIPSNVVVDSWSFRPRDLGFARMGIEMVGADRVVEIWCDVPATVARKRYRSRRRAAVHRDEQRLADDWDTWAEHAAPLGLAATVFVDTTGPVDCAVLAEQVDRVGSAPW
ncbi:AAA family ATPase [Nocardia sp. alder85J]|uniref:AAA family ATPase n=1 Tax=Nocardia sp. alder85J TaxID=2862949 RepID=UPI001CD2279C|nr:AAA family ATPase [Nocardia sp. alder85J]MCX4097940.1 AAA family ATPase [Nocardia sp. alder85J]